MVYVYLFLILQTIIIIFLCIKYRKMYLAQSISKTNNKSINTEIDINKLQSIICKLSKCFNQLTDQLNINFSSVSSLAMSITGIVEKNSTAANSTQDLTNINSSVVDLMENISFLTNEGELKIKEMMILVNNGKKLVLNQIQATKSTINIINEINISIEELQEMIKNILSIAQIITSISKQTNLVALNAAIESAKAGEAGRGFLVVSDEIKKLAYLSNTSAKKIVNIISEVNTKSESLIQSMNNTLSTINIQEDSLNSTQEFFNDILTSAKSTNENMLNTNSSLKDAVDKSIEIMLKSTDIAEKAQEIANITTDVASTSENQIDHVEEIVLLTNNILEFVKELESELSSIKLNKPV
ncbi:UNVERIFIED_CONTAM: methyl-accepting chemotaxis protein [Acetivibrio alkalicellulosi]